jgi:predicted GIY-YIG superfamily endonuclease
MESVKNIVVVELDKTLKRCTDKPHLYVAFTSRDPDNFLEYLQAGNGPKWIRGCAVSLLPKLVPGFKPTRSVAIAKRRVKELCASLKAKGYAVNQDSEVYTVYVIDLDIDKPTKLKNIGRKKKAVYVGQTTKTPEARYLQHKKQDGSSKNLSSRVVFQRGIGLNYGLMPLKRVYTKDAALALEAEVSIKLHNRGYRVFGDGLARALKNAKP